ncbi:hypothetical protein JNUCC0626_18075 [Lentzea sp. JNUCC 0626]|uniref:FDXHR family putative zinc-binding protein n=1 Tax=Lentzea sp. JNUCC 0626 TaxID=3367513 RepID=UPI003748D710
MTTSRCRCGRTWTGTVSAHCACCHEHFSTPKNFDLHKPKARKPNGEPGCRKPAVMTRERQDGTVVPLFKATEGVYGTTWVGWTEESPYQGTFEDGESIVGREDFAA